MKRTCLQKAQLVPTSRETQNEQTACEFHPVEYLDKIAKLEPKEIQKFKNLFG